MHTLLDLRGNIPTFINITDGKVHDVNILDVLIPEPGAIYLIDRGYIDFTRLYTLHQAGAFFVILAKTNLKFKRIYSRLVEKKTGLRCDQTISLVNFYALKNYPERLRRVKIFDAKNDRTLVFLTNIFSMPALSIAQVYKCRWQIELFFKWIKQNLRIKSFLWHFGKCRQNSNLDSSDYLCPGRNIEKTTKPELLALHFFAGFKRKYV